MSECGLCDRDPRGVEECAGCGSHFHAECLAGAGGCPVCAALPAGRAAGGEVPEVPGLTAPLDGALPLFHPLLALRCEGGLGSYTEAGRRLALDGERALELTRAQAWELTPWPSVGMWLGFFFGGWLLVGMAVQLVLLLLGLGRRDIERVMQPLVFAWFALHPFLLSWLRHRRRGDLHWLVRDREGKWLLQGVAPGDGPTSVRDRRAWSCELAGWTSLAELKLRPAGAAGSVLELRPSGLPTIALTPPMPFDRTKDPGRQLLRRVRERIRALGALFEATIEETWVTEALPVAPAGTVEVDAGPPRAAEAGGVCQVCGTDTDADAVACPRCETPHHRDCWEWAGGCSTYGCRTSLPAARPHFGEEPWPDVRDLIPIGRLCALGEVAYWSAGGEAIRLAPGEAAVQLPRKLALEVSDHDKQEWKSLIWVFGLGIAGGAFVCAVRQPGFAVVGVGALLAMTWVLKRWDEPSGRELFWAVRDARGRVELAAECLSRDPFSMRMAYRRQAMGRFVGSGKNRRWKEMTPSGVLLQRSAHGDITLSLEFAGDGSREITSRVTAGERRQTARELAFLRALGQEASGRLGLPYREAWVLRTRAS